VPRVLEITFGQCLDRFDPSRNDRCGRVLAPGAVVARAKARVFAPIASATVTFDDRSYLLIGLG
jgi:hypothetical protein